MVSIPHLSPVARGSLRMSRNNLSSKDCVPLSVKTTSTQYVVFPIRLVIFMLSARSSFLHGSIGCVQGSHAAKLFCCHGFVSISVKLVQVVPFPAAAGAIRCSPPFQAAKEKPAGRLAEEVPLNLFFLLCPSCCGGATLYPLPPCSGGWQQESICFYLPRNELRGGFRALFAGRRGMGVNLCLPACPIERKCFWKSDPH